MTEGSPVRLHPHGGPITAFPAPDQFITTSSVVDLRGGRTFPSERTTSDGNG
jgi:hypothetical protein